jgi:glycosyltransferase involved in cell wall biosynthesis
MRILIAIDGHFLSKGDDVFSLHLTYERFWKRYLQGFDSVLVVARVRPVDTVLGGWEKATGPNVKFCAIPDFYGPWRYLRAYRQIKALIKQAIYEADAYILRAPGVIATSVWRLLMEKKIPYAVEVVADPWNSLAPKSVKSLLRPFFRWESTRILKIQCQKAVAAAYVTQYSLQKRYPPGGWTTYYSDVELPDAAIIGEDQLERNLASLKDVAEGKRPLRICHAGTMEVAYKAQDILLEAVSISISNGLTAELVLLGNGRLFNCYVEKARQLGIEQYVKFLGLLPVGDAVRKQLDLSDIFALPSIAEGLPRILIEAMARAKPCIASNVGGIPELLDKEDMVPPGDARVLAAKIEEVACDWKRMERMSRRNLNEAKKYSLQTLNHRRIEFYNKLAAETRRVTCQKETR